MPRRSDPNLVDSTSVTIRFPPKLYKWLKDKADKEKRSFNAQALLELESRMDSQQSSVTLAATGTVGNPGE